MSDKNDLQTKCVDTIRFLAADAIEKAKSGHPGMPMGAAAAAFTLWTKHLKHNPKNPEWPDRDRFVLSSGHASMLLYALLHLTGYDLSLDDIKNFRQWGSRTPGHPEYRHTAGVEVTTGPLGQGLANAVGMAIAEAHLAARFNREGQTVVDHYTYVMAGDGDMMEGVAAEACALAGHLRLGKLIVLYDDNKVSLAGSTGLSFTENIEMRFKSYGWQVQKVQDGNDVAAIDRAIKKAKKETGKPSLICVQTTIGYGAPGKQGSCDAHGSPLGEKALQGAKDTCAWPTKEPFYVSDDVYKYFRKAVSRGKKSEKSWLETIAACRQKDVALADELERTLSGELPLNWDASLAEFPAGSKDVATRKASEIVMQSIAANVPELAGGSADLNPSTFTWLKGLGDFQNPDQPREGLHGMVGGAWDYSGRNIHFGVREHAMGAIAVGMALHGGMIPYTATFLTFDAGSYELVGRKNLLQIISMAGGFQRDGRERGFHTARRAGRRNLDRLHRPQGPPRQRQPGTQHTHRAERRRQCADRQGDPGLRLRPGHEAGSGQGQAFGGHHALPGDRRRGRAGRGRSRERHIHHA